MEKQVNRTSVILLSLGIVLLVVAALWAMTVNDFLRTAVTATGEVIGFEKTGTRKSSSYQAVVRFTPHSSGQAVVFRNPYSGIIFRGFSVGERVTVVYQKSNPVDARVRSFMSLWGGAFIVGIMGGTLSLIGGNIVYSRLANALLGDELRITGSAIQTDFKNVKKDASVAVSGQHSYQIVTQWKDPATNQVYLFKSRKLWFDPTPYISGEQITVYRDSQNPTRYYMDVSFLLGFEE